MRKSYQSIGRSAGLQRSAVGRAWHAFLSSNSGTALTEYALLLGAFACAVLAGLQFSDDQGIPVYQHLAGTLADGETLVSSADQPIVGVGDTSDSSHSGTSELESRSHRAEGWPAALFFTAAASIMALWYVTRFRRRRSPEEPTDEEPTTEGMENRLHTKRRILWKNVLNDPRLLFKNRVEVRHLMTREVSVIARRTPAAEIRRLMDDKHMHHALVCDSDGRLLGVVSDRDVHRGTEGTAAELMTADPVAVRPDTTASAAIATMLERQISCVPVVEDERVCGILTRTDLLLSLQCMLQWWLRFAQTVGRAAECSDKIDGVQEASGRCLFQQRVRLQTLSQSLGPNGKPAETTDWESFTNEAEAFLATAGELIAMQTFEGDRLSEMAGELLEITKP